MNENRILDESYIMAASSNYNIFSQQSVVNLQFSIQGSLLWKKITYKSSVENTGIAIIINDKVISAPVASERIIGGTTQISGETFSNENGKINASKLAEMLNSHDFYSKIYLINLEDIIQ